MNLAFLGSRGIPGIMGGYERVAEEIGSRLVEKGHRVTVFCERGRSAPDRPDSHKGIDLRYLPHLGGKAFEAPSFDAISLLMASLSRYDLVYLMGYSMSWLAWLPKMADIPVVINTDGLEWKRSKWNRFARWYLRRSEAFAARVATGLAADSRAIADHFQKAYRRSSYFVGNGADLWEPTDESTPSRYGLKPYEYLTIVCRIEPENNVDLLIEGYLASGVEYPLVVIGGANYNSPYVSSLRRYESDRVRFTGIITEKSELMDLRYFAAAYLHGHEVGGTNPSLLEALGCGNCVLAVDVPYNAEVLADSGVLIPKEIDGWATAIRATLNDDILLSTLRRKSRERLLEAYTWQISADLHEKCFHAILSDR